MSTNLTDKFVICRKDHKCDWCGQGMAAGEKAHYSSGVFDGDFYSGHQHLECHKAILDSDDWHMNTEGYQPYEQQRGKTYEDSHA